MNDRPTQEEATFAQAVKCASERERAAFLDEACRGKAELRARLELLLEGYFKGEGFLSNEPQLRSADEAVGRTIGRYKLLENVGEGGCGVVYVAEQTEPVRRRVALKVIKLGMDTKAVVARFEAERQALALMEHPNIAKVFDAGSTDTGRPYFVMELVRGIKITDYCDQNNLPTKERLKLFIQVCQAIQHAHQKGIIHRDIKPSNVLVTLQDGVPMPKVIDFGIAKATEGRLTGATVYTQLHQLIGTPAYMSPEQAEMASVDVDTRSDIYSLGVLLYELLTGRTPFDTQELLSAGIDRMRRTIRETEPLRPSTRLATLKQDELTATAQRRSAEAPRLISSLKGDLDCIVMKCLEKDRNRRFDTANWLAVDVRRYLNDEPVVARPSSKLYRLGKSIRRNKLAYAAVTAVLAVLVLGIVVSTLETLRAKRAERAAQANQQKSEKETAKASAISDFLQQLLRSANPENLKGMDYTVRQLLDDFSAGLEAQLKGQPEVEATVRATIGRAYWRLGDGAKAQAYLERALALRLELFGAQDDRVAESLVDCAWACLEQGDYRKSETYARQASGIYRARNTSGQPMLYALWVLQKTLTAQERFSEVAAVTEEALRIANKTPGVEFPEVASMIHGLAEAKTKESKFPEAESLARRALDMHWRLRSTNDIEIAWALTALGQALESQQKPTEAEHAFRDALAIFRRQYSSGHKSVSRVIYELTKLLQTTGDNTGLEVLYRDDLAAQRVPLARDSLALAETLASLAGILEAQGKQQEAERALQEALEMLKLQSHTSAVPSSILRRLSQALYQIAQKLPEQGSEAEWAARAALELSSRCVQGDPQSADQAAELGHAQWELAKLLVSTARREQAESVLREAEQTFEKATRDFPYEPYMRQELAFSHRLIGDLVEGDQRMGEAERQYRAAIALYAALKHDLPANAYYHEEEAYTRWTLAEKLKRAGRLELAGAEYRQAIALYENALAAFPAATRETQSRLGNVLLSFAALLRSQRKEWDAQMLEREAAERGDAGIKNEIAWRLAINPNAGPTDLSKAVVYAERVVSATRRTNAAYLDTLAAACAAAGQFTNAVRFEKEALTLVPGEQKQGFVGRLKLYESNLPYRDHHVLAESATIFLEQQKFAEAEQVARECLAIREILVPQEWLVFSARSLLGASLLGQRKYTDAEPLLLSAYEGLKAREGQIPPAGKQRLPETVRRIVQLYEETIRPEQAAKWKKKLTEFVSARE